MLEAGRKLKEEYGDRAANPMAGASPLHITAVQVLNQMGGEFKPDMYGFLLELHGITEPEILYYVINAVLRNHDHDQS